jgi:hypothetical protein
MKAPRFVVLLAALWACAGGGTDPDAPGGGGQPPGTGSLEDGGGGGPGDPGDGPGGAGAEETLLWKRGVALASDLGRALVLTDDELCTEVSNVPCAEVHRSPLGRADPFGTGLLEPVAHPLATTALATERIVLSACSTRVDKDRAGSAMVFEGVDLRDTAMPADAAAQRVIAEQIANLLYPRLLARTPTPAEVDVLRELAIGSSGQPVSRRDFAKLTCFAIATTTEFVLY